MVTFRSNIMLEVVCLHDSGMQTISHLRASTYRQLFSDKASDTQTALEDPHYQAQSLQEMNLCFCRKPIYDIFDQNLFNDMQNKSAAVKRKLCM